MATIDLTKCTRTNSVALDADGRMDDFLGDNEASGFRVFYEVPREELAKVIRLFHKESVPENVPCGELEIEISEPEHSVGEVLLWLTEETEEALENTDFVEYDGDVSILVDAFEKNRATRPSLCKEEEERDLE